MKGPIKIWNERHRALIGQFAGGLERRARAEMEEALAGLCDLTQSLPFYLARSLDAEAKRVCARAHYELLLRLFSPEALLRLIAGNVPLWRFPADELALRIDLRLEHWVAREGELTLEIFSGRKMLYLLSFSFAPAPLFGLGDGTALLLTRVQGRPGEFDDIRAATKAMSEVAPRAALFAALTGVARAVGVRHALGVAAENHVGFDPAKREMMARQYDEFFLALDGVPRDGFFEIDLEAEPKPVNAQKTGHRVRTRRKRQFKADVAARAGEVWASFNAPPA